MAEEVDIMDCHGMFCHLLIIGDGFSSEVESFIEVGHDGIAIVTTNENCGTQFDTSLVTSCYIDGDVVYAVINVL